ncbi:MAG: hypothetical protein ACD_62C00572G0003 [uncultured bacterium]|nr:MAG: hypothetical protein ACD_62C00572G0003 [uncultured bacterium]
MIQSKVFYSDSSIVQNRIIHNKIFFDNCQKMISQAVAFLTSKEKILTVEQIRFVCPTSTFEL